MSGLTIVPISTGGALALSHAVKTKPTHKAAANRVGLMKVFMVNAPQVYKINPAGRREAECFPNPRRILSV